MDKTHLGKRLQDLRAEKNLRSSQFATTIGVEPSTYSRIEKGSRHIKIEQLNKLADFLEVSHEEMHSLWLADKVLEVIEELPVDISKKAISIVYEQINSKK